MTNLERARVWKVKHDQLACEFKSPVRGGIGDPWELLFEFARRLDTQSLPPEVAAGMVLVPVEPTQKMYSAFSIGWLNTQRVKPPVKFAAAYKAMLEAALEPQSRVQEKP